MNLTDHAGVRLTHGKPEVNGVEIHYAIGGAGEPVFLLHGTPKTMSYWRHVMPLLTPHYTVIAVDNRGGEHDPSLAADDMRTGWHFSFFSLPNLPELLLAGRERPFWTWYARRQMWDPSALAEEDIDEIVYSAEQPGGTRAILEMYRAARPTPNRTARITPTRSAARSWPSARRPISGTMHPSSSHKWPATSAAPSSPRPVTTSRWRTRPPWPRPTSTSSQAAKPRVQPCDPAAYRSSTPASSEPQAHDPFVHV